MLINVKTNAPNTNFLKTSKQSIRRGPNSAFAKAQAYIENEFFNLDQDMAMHRHFWRIYGAKYGQGALDYLWKTYTGWKSGTVGMSGQTRSRLLNCVPPVLSKEKQFTILSFYYDEIIEQFADDLKHCPPIKVSELYDLFIEVLLFAKEREIKLGWFVQDLFSPTEIENFTNLTRYTVIDSICKTYEIIIKDLDIIRHLFIKQNKGCLELTYEVRMLKCRVEIDQHPAHIPKKIDYDLNIPELGEKYNELYKRILLDHALRLREDEARAEHINAIAISDVKSLLDRIGTLDHTFETDSLVECMGGAGCLKIHFWRKNRYKMYCEFLMSLVKCILVVVVVTALCFWLVKTKVAIMSFYIGFIGVCIFGGALGECIEKRKEILDYDRKRIPRVKKAR
jgi:predicted DNA-binding protein YlxM (UPF0122 family)